MRLRLALLSATLILACAGESVEREESASRVALPAAQAIDPPAPVGAFAANLAVADGRLVATWLEKTAGEDGSGHRLRVSALDGSDWSEPVTVVEGDDFFANWADFPALVEAGDGSLLVHWLAKTGEETYAYSIFVARSVDGGATWSALGRLNDDDTPTEHGFVSWLPEGEGARAFWLDGREMAAGGTMTLRTARVGAEIGPAEVLDEMVCECCATGAARAAAGPLVVYRDRTEGEVRDISIVRSADGWSSPVAVADDGWVIPGCPVNGPRVGADDERVAVGWFTLAEQTPRVRLAVSDDGGASFEAPLVLDEDAPFGRVDVVLGEDGSVWTVWLAKAGERASVALQSLAADGELGERASLGETSGGRMSGFPRLARIGGSLYVAWLEIAEGVDGRVRVARLEVG